MKNNFYVSFLVVTTFVLIFSQTGFAQDMKGKFGLGARLAYVNIEDSDYNYSGYEIDNDFDDAFMRGINITYFVHRYFSFELSADYIETDVDLKINNTIVGDCDFKQYPILLTARSHFSTNPKVNPYVGVGIGYYLNDFDSSDFVDSLLPPGVKLEIDNSIGFHINTGVEIFLDEHFAFNLELKYLWNKTDMILQAPGYLTEKDSIDLNIFVTGVGFKYYF